MAFVPTAPPRREASARAQDLGRRLKAEIEKFEAQYPGTSPEDIRAAAELAVGMPAGSRRSPRDAGRLIGLIAAASAVVGSMFATAAARGESTRVLLPAVITSAIVAMVLVVAIAIRWRKHSG